MTISDRTSQIFIGLLTAATSVWAAHVALQIFQQQVPQKALTINLTVFDLSENFGKLGTKAVFSLKVGERNFDNLVLFQAQIENVGQNPIVEGDVKKPLTINSAKGWEIVAVEDGALRFGGAPNIRWERKSPTSFESGSGFLLNPAEVATANVYISRTEPSIENKDEPRLTWDMRVLNMPWGPRIVITPTYTVPFFYGARSGLLIGNLAFYISFMRALALLCVAAVTLFAYLRLIVATGSLNLPAWITASRIVVAALISFALAEALTDSVASGFSRDANQELKLWLHLFVMAVATIYAIYLHRRRADKF